MELLELVDRDLLERLQNNFTDLLGFNVAFADLNSKTLGIKKTGDKCSLCSLMMNKEQGEERCNSSDREAGQLALIKKKPILYRCQCYFSNFVIPIIVHKEVIGFLYGGQFFVRAPGVKTPKEWEAEKILKGGTDSTWENEKRKIIDEEEKEWNTLHDQLKFYIYTGGEKQYIRPHFFHQMDGHPTQEDLKQIALSGGNTTESDIQNFIENYSNQSDLDKNSDRVKNFKEVLNAIRILWEIANALSGEGNTKYTLKTYVEVCEEIKFESRLKKILKIFQWSKIKTDDFTLLSKNITDFVDTIIFSEAEKKREEEAEKKREENINKIDQLAINIYTNILHTEKKRLSHIIKINRLIYMDLNLITDNNEYVCRINTSGSKTLNEEKVSLRNELKYIRNCQKEIIKRRSIAGPIGWAAFIVTVIGLIVAIPGSVPFLNGIPTLFIEVTSRFSGLFGLMWIPVLLGMTTSVLLFIILKLKREGIINEM